MITIEDEWERLQDIGSLDDWPLPIWRHPKFREIAKKNPSINNWILPLQIPSKKSVGDIELARRLFELFVNADWKAAEWDSLIDQIMLLKDWKLIIPMVARTIPIQLYSRFPFDLDCLQAWESLLTFIKDPDQVDAGELVRVILAKALQGSWEPRRAALFMRTVVALLGTKQPIRYKTVLNELSPELSAFALTWISTSEGQTLFNALRQNHL